MQETQTMISNWIKVDTISINLSNFILLKYIQRLFYGNRQRKDGFGFFLCLVSSNLCDKKDK